MHAPAAGPSRTPWRAPGRADLPRPKRAPTAGRARPPHRAPACPARGGAGRKRGRYGGRTSAASERALDFDALEALDLVARLHVVVLLHADTALGAAADLVDVLLEAAQGFQLALEDHGVVAQHADRLVAPDHALHDHAAGHGAELGTAEYVADLGRADDLFADLHAQDARRDLPPPVDHVVDERKLAQVPDVAPP